MLTNDLLGNDLQSFNSSRTNDFVRAEKVYRELLVAHVENLSWREHPSPSVVSMQLNIDVLGKVMVINVDRTYRLTEVRFFKIRPKDFMSGAPGYWSAYWVRGKGMKVYGDPEAFKKDLVLLKMGQ
jgi:hypothetical protein